MHPVEQNRQPAVKQEESSTLKWVGDLAQTTLEGIKNVTAPGFSAATSLFGSATRACYWLAEQSWQGLYNSSLNVGTESPEAKKLTETWDSLRENAPHLDRLGARLGELSTLLEKAKPNTPEFAELMKQREQVLEHLNEHLQANAPHLTEMKRLHETLLSSEVERYKVAGLSTDEIEQKVAVLKQSRQNLDQAVAQTLQAVTTLEKFIEKHEQQMEGALSQDLTEYRGLTRRRGVAQDQGVVDANEEVRERCHGGCCRIKDGLGKVKSKLKEGDVDGGFMELKGVRAGMEHYVEDLQHWVKDYQEKRNTSLIESGLDKSEFGVFATTDSLMKQYISGFASFIVEAYKTIVDSYQQVYKSLEDFNRESISYLRMNNAAYYGGAGSSVLSLGLFEGPYAVSALSYIAEQERLEKLAKKMHFLAPPPTLEEREQYKKIS